MKRFTNHHLARRLAALAMMWLLGAALLPAQPPPRWEWVYGSAATTERTGQVGGFTLVTGCGTGQISAGRTIPATGGSWDVYLVRTSTTGAPIWEKTYDIGGFNGLDQAQAVRETANGFIVCGTTDRGTGPSYMFLMEVDCNGNVIWSQIYGDGINAYDARDVIVAANRDIVVAGYTMFPPNPMVPTYDALLMRTTSTGGILWQHNYDTWTLEEGWIIDDKFHALVEATLNSPPGWPPQTVGDIVAAGNTTNFSRGFDALAVRVDGATGLPSNINHGAVRYSTFGGDFFSGVIEQQMGSTGNLFFVGSTQAQTSSLSDAYVVSTTLQPWIPIARRRIGDIGGGLEEHGTRIAEVLVATLLSNPGDMVITGVMDNWIDPLNANNRGSDACILNLEPNFLFVTRRPGVPAPGNYFGDHGALDDGGFAIDFDINPPASGYVISGFTNSNMDRAIPPDPGDFYLVRTDHQGKTGCEIAWTPRDTVPPDSVFMRNLALSTTVNPLIVPTFGVSVNWGTQVCNKPLGKAVPVPLNDDAEAVFGIGNDPSTAPGESSIRVMPNPITSGRDIHITFREAGEHGVKLLVVDAMGQVVRATVVHPDPGAGMITISTEGWPAGSYMMKLDNGIVGQTFKLSIVK